MIDERTGIGSGQICCDFVSVCILCDRYTLLVNVPNEMTFGNVANEPKWKLKMATYIQNSAKSILQLTKRHRFFVMKSSVTLDLSENSL